MVLNEAPVPLPPLGEEGVAGGVAAGPLPLGGWVVFPSVVGGAAALQVVLLVGMAIYKTAPGKVEALRNHRLRRLQEKGRSTLSRRHACACAETASRASLAHVNACTRARNVAVWYNYIR